MDRQAWAPFLGFAAVTVGLFAWIWGALLGLLFPLGLAVAIASSFGGFVLLPALLLVWRNGPPGWVGTPRRFASNVALGLAVLVVAYLAMFFANRDVSDGDYLFGLGLLNAGIAVGFAERAQAHARPNLSAGLVGAAVGYAVWAPFFAVGEHSNPGVVAVASILVLFLLQLLPLAWPTRILIVAGAAVPILLLDRLLEHGWLLRAVELSVLVALALPVLLLRDRLPRPGEAPGLRLPQGAS